MVGSYQQSEFRNELLYTGRRIDPATGLQLNRFRFYHTGLGRWIHRDPIRYWGGDTNLYGYVSANPIGELDALGLAKEGDCCTSPAPGFPNVYDPDISGLLRSSGAGRPSASEDLMFGVDGLQIALAIVEIIETGATTPGKKAGKMIQDFLEGQGKGQVSPNGNLIDLAQDWLNDLSNDIQRRDGFYLWVEVEYLACENNRYVKRKRQVFYDEGNGGRFGGEFGVDLTFGDISRAKENAIDEVLGNN